MTEELRREQEIYKVREKICETGKKLWQLGFVAGNDGNISVRFDKNTILVTPSGVSKADMTPERDMSRRMIIEMQGCTEENYSEDEYLVRPSSEFRMHLRCYSRRQDIGAVVHAHPPFATAFAAAGIPLDDYTLSEAVMLLGSVPVAPYATPGTSDVPDSITPFLEDHDAILLANHGALTVGVDLEQAYFRMENLEHIAKTTFITRLLGGAKELPLDKINELCDIAKHYPVRHPGYKKYSK